MAAVHAAILSSAPAGPARKMGFGRSSGERVQPPPPDTPTLDETPEKPATVTLREQLEVHRSKPECASCHSRMDPLGFGLENFDVLGRWRDTDRGQPVDAQGTLPSGETFTGPDGLKTLLMTRKDDVMKHLVRKLAGFAFGRELNRFDQCVIDQTMEALQANHYRASILIEQIATSFPFRHRFYPKPNVASGMMNPNNMIPRRTFLRGARRDAGLAAARSHGQSAAQLFT